MGLDQILNPMGSSKDLEEEVHMEEIASAPNEQTAAPADAQTGHVPGMHFQAPSPAVAVQEVSPSLVPQALLDDESGLRLDADDYLVLHHTDAGPVDNHQLGSHPYDATPAQRWDDQDTAQADQPNTSQPHSLQPEASQLPVVQPEDAGPAQMLQDTVLLNTIQPGCHDSSPQALPERTRDPAEGGQSGSSYAEPPAGPWEQQTSAGLAGHFASVSTKSIGGAEPQLTGQGEQEGSQHGREHSSISAEHAAGDHHRSCGAEADGNGWHVLQNGNAAETEGPSQTEGNEVVASAQHDSNGVVKKMLDSKLWGDSANEQQSGNSPDVEPFQQELSGASQQVLNGQKRSLSPPGGPDAENGLIAKRQRLTLSGFA